MPNSSANDQYLERFPDGSKSKTKWLAELAKLDDKLAARHHAMDYSTTAAFENVAVYAPALSEGWVNTIQAAIDRPEDFHFPQFADFELVAEDLQFTNPNSRLCFYPWVLYSAGQAVNVDSADQSRAWKSNWLTQQPRDPNVVVIGDSGGFQILQQTMSFHGNPTVKRILKWLEEVADYSMVLDFPTSGISSGVFVEHTRRLMQEGVPIETLAQQEGLDSGLVTSLVQTIRNNRTYVRAQNPKQTKILNVLQGRNEEESKYWFERVKAFPFEGWSFAGKHHSELAMTLRRLIEMRDSGLLARCEWIHFLGVSTFKVAAVLTYLQRALREHTNAKSVQISFDSKSPVDVVINGYKPIIGYDFDPDKWTFRVETLPLQECASDTRMLNEIGRDWQNEKPNRHIAKTALSYRLQLNQLVSFNSDRNRYLPNGLQQALLIHHNSQAFFEGFRRSYSYLNDGGYSQRPKELRLMEMYIQQVFKSENPMSVIDALQDQLNVLGSENL
ncbi:MAG: hypothetical protein ABJH63_15315 [Rhizobiaceae bacterium]